MSFKKNDINFKRNTGKGYSEYYLTICNQTNFLKHSIYDSYPCYFDYETLYKLGIRDAFHMDDNSWVYSLIVEYFALDKSVHIIAPNLKDMDKEIEAIEIYWSHWLNFDCQTGEPKDNISSFEHIVYYALAEIDRETISLFAHAFQTAITTFTFVIGADEKELIDLLNQKKKKPQLSELLAISDCMVSIKIVEDDEGRNNHVAIQANKSIFGSVKRISYLMKYFCEKYNNIVLAIGSLEDIEVNTNNYVKEVSQLKKKIFNGEHTLPKIIIVYEIVQSYYNKIRDYLIAK